MRAGSRQRLTWRACCWTPENSDHLQRYLINQQELAPLTKMKFIISNDSKTSDRPKDCATFKAFFKEGIDLYK